MSSWVKHKTKFWTSCKKYTVTVIFYYIFHIKPQFFKTLFQSQFLLDFDDIFTNRSENVCSFLSFSGLFFRSEYKWILYLTTMYVYCVYPAMSKKSENWSDLNKKDRNKRHSSPFINVVTGVFFVVRVTLVPYHTLSCNQYICCTNMLYE
jgi:hypothetical protein